MFHNATCAYRLAQLGQGLLCSVSHCIMLKESFPESEFVGFKSHTCLEIMSYEQPQNRHCASSESLGNARLSVTLITAISYYIMLCMKSQSSRACPFRFNFAFWWARRKKGWKSRWSIPEGALRKLVRRTNLQKVQKENSELKGRLSMGRFCFKVRQAFRRMCAFINSENGHFKCN